MKKVPTNHKRRGCILTLLDRKLYEAVGYALFSINSNGRIIGHACCEYEYKKAWSNGTISRDEGYHEKRWFSDEDEAAVRMTYSEWSRGLDDAPVDDFEVVDPEV